MFVFVVVVVFADTELPFMSLLLLYWEFLAAGSVSGLCACWPVDAFNEREPKGTGNDSRDVQRGEPGRETKDACIGAEQAAFLLGLLSVSACDRIRFSFRTVQTHMVSWVEISGIPAVGIAHIPSKSSARKKRRRKKEEEESEFLLLSVHGGEKAY